MLVLIGYRGTGKTTVARLVAERLGWPWVDADVEIESRAGKSIKEIFDDDGEERFRDLETEVVADLARRKQTVVALGGGAVLREENRAAVRGCTVVWLQAGSETIHARIASDPSTGARRPNLTVAGGRAEITDLLAQREPVYKSCADCAVDTEGRTPEQIADQIVCLWTGSSAGRP